jgi:hypothetical protein
MRAGAQTGGGSELSSGRVSLTAAYYLAAPLFATFLISGLLWVKVFYGSMPGGGTAGQAA